MPENGDLIHFLGDAKKVDLRAEPRWFLPRYGLCALSQYGAFKVVAYRDGVIV